MYRRYIDDLIILWEGTTETFEEFLEDLNTNRYGITFTGKWNHKLIDYLDLEIFKSGGALCTRTFFKTTDRSGYISTTSYHHPKWKSNVPKGKLLRIRRNCDIIEDFHTQADMLVKRFQEKGYEQDNLEKLKLEVLKMDRDALFRKKIRKKDNQIEMAFVNRLQYPIQDF